MCPFMRKSILVWILLLMEKQDKFTCASTQEKVSSALLRCKKDLKIPTLEVLPGGGWDNLRNLDMGRVMNVGYSSCKTTEDDAYIIPDEVFVIPQKQTNLEMNSEIVETWKSYTSFTSISINSEISALGLINAKFSTDFQNMKTHQVRDQSFTTRVQVRNHRYTVKANPSFTFDPAFKSQLVSIANHLENNHTQMANFLAEILILNYGTHVLTSVDAGACLVQVDHVSSKFLGDTVSQRTSISASAGASFHDLISFGFGVNTSFGSSSTSNYMSNRTSSRVESIGGVPFYPGITLKTWQEGITNQLVAIDRAGMPLQFFINPHTLPDLPEPTVTKLWKTVEAASNRYYKVNTHPGCTEMNSPNFNFHANVDDDSCNDKMINFTFGGAYQDCAEIHGVEAGLICQRLEQKNPLTGQFSCPRSYAPVKIRSQNVEQGYSRYECHKYCVLTIFCHWVCGDVFRVSTARFSAYWCVAQGGVTEGSGYLFGGLFNSKSVNPLTTAQSCPSSYYPLKLFVDLQVCVSDDYEMGFRYSVPFGGFFTCDTGNPLASSKTSSALKGSLEQGGQTELPMKCPPGYSQHLALMSEVCQIMYCIQSGLFTGGTLPPVRLPPFSSPPIMSAGTTNTVMVMTETDRSWVKDPNTQMWKLTNTADASSNFKLISGSSTHVSSGQAAGITVGATTALAILIAMAIYGRRKYRNRGYEELEHRQIVSNDPDCDVMESIASPITQQREESA